MVVDDMLKNPISSSPAESQISTPLLSTSESSVMHRFPSTLSRTSSSSSSTNVANNDATMDPGNIVRYTSSKDRVFRNLGVIFALGTLVGFVMPKNEDLPSPIYRQISSCIGWIYFLCWSISFYPQIILNYQRQSTTGLSSDFSLLNVVGFICYSIYTGCFFWSDTIKNQYKERHSDISESESSTVQSNDVAFAFHAFLLSSVQLGQIFYYHTSRQRSGYISLFSKWTRYFLIGAALLCVSYGGLLWCNPRNDLLLIDYLYMLSSIKLTITTIKYMPQAFLNYRRKSTVGWNIYNALLDVCGGLLSLLQLVLDCVDMNEWSGITGNWVKFGLSFVSIGFSTLFITQHYILYPQPVEYETVDGGEEPPKA